MEYENTPRRIEIENRRSLLDGQKLTPEIAITARFAQEFGHVAIRHANDEISTADYDRFRELYVDKLMKQTPNIDRTAVARGFDFWVDAMLPAAQADIYDALAEQQTDVLPDFVSPGKMSEMATSADDELMHVNLQLTEENARLMNQVAGMWKERRAMRQRMTSMQDELDDLRLRVGVTYDDVMSDR